MPSALRRSTVRRSSSNRMGDLWGAGRHPNLDHLAPAVVLHVVLYVD